MARKTKEDTLKTVTAILDAAEAVFVRHGVAKATIAQIAEEAGVSKGAVYGHYRDKMEVCTAVCQRGLAGLFQITRLKAGETNLAALHRWGVEYMRLLLESTSCRNAGSILYEKCENSPEFEPIQKIRQIWERQAFKVTGWLIRRAITAGELPPGTNARHCDLYLHSLIDGLICLSFCTGRIPAANPMQTIESILKIGIQGIRNAHVPA